MENNEVLKEEIKKMKFWLREELSKRGFKKIVIGISGGFDSSFAAYLAASEDCLGPDNILGILMPCESSPDSVGDAEDLARELKIKYTTVSLLTPVCELVNNINLIRENMDWEKLNNIDRGNIKARMRMITLYSFASSFNGLVLNTSNYSEIMSGNGTKFGDGAGDISLFGHYTKTYLYKMAELSGFKEMFPNIYNKVPTADLEPNQTDEGTMGIIYKDLDKYLDGDWVDRMDMEKNKTEIVEKINKLMEKSEHKREKMPAFHSYYVEIKNDGTMILKH